MRSARGAMERTEDDRVEPAGMGSTSNNVNDRYNSKANTPYKVFGQAVRAASCLLFSRRAVFKVSFCDAFPHLHAGHGTQKKVG